MDEARLVVPHAGGFRTVAVTRFPFRLGRHHENDLVLEEGDVSRHHAEIVKEGERYVLSDTNSRFGTFLNGAFGLPNKSPNNLVGDGVDQNDVPFMTSFPYVATPHSGYEVP